MRKLFSALMVVGAALAALPAAADDRLNVVASFSILGDMVRQVAGDKAAVTTIVGPDADAHIYTP
ncbi:MAG: zinc ABC transporter substrate-binding protein, partial [Rhodospirillaceae bacterium]|nr:zinc ABC transporter substrate-binding protein [Rhodospirillaceae bacterium]